MEGHGRHCVGAQIWSQEELGSSLDLTKSLNLSFLFCKVVLLEGLW